MHFVSEAQINVPMGKSSEVLKYYQYALFKSATNNSQFTFPKKCSIVPWSLSKASGDRTKSMKLMLSTPSDEQVLSVALIIETRSWAANKET